MDQENQDLTFPPEVDAYIRRQWVAGVPSKEIAAEVSRRLGREISTKRLQKRANKLGVKRADGFPGKTKVHYQKKVKIRRRRLGWDPQPALFDEVKEWAEERGVPFNSWDDLPAVNHRAFMDGERGFSRVYWVGGRRAA